MLLLDHEPLPDTVGIPLSLNTLARTREDRELSGSKCSRLFTHVLDTSKYLLALAALAFRASSLVPHLPINFDLLFLSYAPS